MPQKQLPLILKGVLKGLVGRYFHPVVTKNMGQRNIRIPDNFRCIDPALRFTRVQTSNGTAVCAIDLDSELFVAIHAHAPRRIELSDDIIFQEEGGIGRVVSRDLVTLPLKNDIVAQFNTSWCERVNRDEQLA